MNDLAIIIMLFALVLAVMSVTFTIHKLSNIIENYQVDDIEKRILKRLAAKPANGE
jgi:hypothetical protein